MGAPPRRDRAKRSEPMINLAITSFVFAALVLCGVIVGLFVSAYYAWSPDLTRGMAALFALAMLSLIGGLLGFLREVYMATASLRIGLIDRLSSSSRRLRTKLLLHEARAGPRYWLRKACNE